MTSIPLRSVSGLLREFAAAGTGPRGVYAAFGGVAPFYNHVRALDRFAPLPSLPVGRRAGLLPRETRERFAADCVRGWTTGRRPGLPQLAQALLRDKGVDIGDRTALGALPPQERALARAVMLVAARAEMNRSGAVNAYHNPVHTAHVATMAGYLADLNDQLTEGYGRFSEFCLRDKLIIVLAAFAHDIDHPGQSNPPGQPYKNERAAINAALPILHAAGVTPQDCTRFEMLILPTSPDGPHAYLKQVATAQAEMRGTRHDPARGFDELAPLCADRTLTQMAAILSDADLFASGGAGMQANRIMSRRLTNEARKAGHMADFTTPQARAGFLTHVIGRAGFVSQAARAAFNRDYRAFVAANDALLKKTPAP